MDNFKEYANLFLAALYLETEVTGREYHSASSIHEKYGVEPRKEHWVARLADDWEFSFFKDVSKVLGGYSGWSFRISAAGSEKVEDDLGDLDRVRQSLEEYANTNSDTSSSALSAGSERNWISASDRLVPIDHNQPGYMEVAQGLRDLHEQIRQDNEMGTNSAQRERLLVSLQSAELLWSASELSLIQIKVGILMAVEEATDTLKRLGKSVGSSIITDLVKRFVKNAIGIDL